MVMEVIDVHSKGPEIFVMENTTAEETVYTLRSLFPRMGLTDHIAAANGPQSHWKMLGNLRLQMVLSMPLVHPTTPRLMSRQKD